MNPHDQRIIHSSVEANWRTPPELFIALDRQFHFDVDVCASAESTYCAHWYGPDHAIPEYRDALKVFNWGGDWGNGRCCFINPPWSRTLHRAEKKRDPAYAGAYAIQTWAMHCAAQALRGATVVGVFPYSHQTEWWYSFVRNGDLKAHEIREIPHRVSFLRPDGSPASNAGGNTAIIIWQPNYGYVGDWQPVQRVWDYR